MRVLALVTARGGSKGFPGKNLALLAGRPLVRWSYRLLEQTARHLPPDVTWLPRLSTDDPAIAAAWPEHARPDQLRPSELASDTARSIDVVRYEVQRCAELGEPCDAVLLLQPTTPLLNVDDLLAMWQTFRGEGQNNPCVIGVTPSPHPVQWALSRDDDGVLRAIGETNEANRQQQTGSYLPCGVYLSTAAFIYEHEGYQKPGVTRSVIVPPRRAIDIDEPMDLAFAERAMLAERPEQSFTLDGQVIGIDETDETDKTGGSGGGSTSAPAPVFVIAEAGVNHNGDPDLARQLIHAAADAGANAVKFQTFKAEDLVTADARKASYQQANTDAEESQHAMLKRLELEDSVFGELKREAEARGLVFLSSPFDAKAAALLDALNVAAIKLGSGELTNHPLLAELARMGRPLLISTGMATLEEVEDAAAVLEAHWRDGESPRVCWLHCVSSYPAPVEQSNLRAMQSLRLAVGGPVGMSDHTMGFEVTLAAAAMGARVIEKHLTLSRDMAGPDHAASLEPAEFKAMMQQLRRIESAMGDGVKRPVPCELDTREVARKSIVAARDLQAGHVLQPGDLSIKRPGTGMPPSELAAVLNRRLSQPLAAGNLLEPKHLA